MGRGGREEEGTRDGDRKMETERETESQRVSSGG